MSPVDPHDDQLEETYRELWGEERKRPGTMPKPARPDVPGGAAEEAREPSSPAVPGPPAGARDPRVPELEQELATLQHEHAQLTEELETLKEYLRVIVRSLQPPTATVAEARKRLQKVLKEIRTRGDLFPSDEPREAASDSPAPRPRRRPRTGSQG